MTEDDLLRLRGALYDIAEVVVDRISARDLRFPSYREVIESLPADDRADVEERAAIMEYDGNQLRNDAERAAVIDFCERRDRHATRHS